MITSCTETFFYSTVDCLKQSGSSTSSTQNKTTSCFKSTVPYRESKHFYTMTVDSGMNFVVKITFFSDMI